MGVNYDQDRSDQMSESDITCLGEDSVTFLEVVSTPEETGDLQTA